MQTYLNDPGTYVQFAVNLLNKKESLLRSITITRPEKSEESFVVTATIEFWDGTQMQTYSEEWLNT